MARPADMPGSTEYERRLREAGVHFGHTTRQWNPKMRRFIYGEREGIYIIDLKKTTDALENAAHFAHDIAQRGGTVLFVGTKKEARDAIKDVAESCGMPYVHHRWLGGLLVNFDTISQRIRRLHDLERYDADGQLARLPTRERLAAQADLEKLRTNLGGVKNMQRQPDAMFIIDLKAETLAVREAQRLRIPIIGLVNTDADPDGIEYVIPGNDAGVDSCRAISAAIGESIRSGQAAGQQGEDQRVRHAGQPPAAEDEKLAGSRSEGDENGDSDESDPPGPTGQRDRSDVVAWIATVVPERALSTVEERAVSEMLDAAGELWDADTSRTWLASPNGYLDGARPIDVLLARGPDDVRDALDAALSGAYA